MSRRCEAVAPLLLFLVFAAPAIAQDEEELVGERIPSMLMIEELNDQLPGIAGDGIAPRKIVQIALNLIKVFEGWVPYLYNDPAGYCTVGYGHLIAKNTCRR